MDISKVVALPVLTMVAIIIRTVYIKKHCPSSKDTTSNLQLTDPCSSSSSSSQPNSWDVFLSFYGKDTRRNFISHLYKALDDTGFLTFRDDPALEKGEEISSGLLHAIKESKMFVVVISENYARSSWCLDELVQILTCKSRDNQVVPVFYYVDPSDLRHQKGCFGEALHHHKKRYSRNMIDKWKSALAQISKLSGYHLQKNSNENESETIQQIVENVARQVSTKSLHLEKVLFGIDYAVEEIYQKLRMELNHVRAIGICGMGGIGKTTTAKAFYNKYSHKFDISCFVDKVKPYSQGGSPLLPLFNQVLTGILRKKDYKVTDVEVGLRKLKQILPSKKALVILDDLEQSSCSEFLATICDLFSAGSRIIITTRDANLLNKVVIPEVDVYMVKTLEKSDSLKLFSYHAFRKPVPPENFWKLSLSFVTYAGGLPLALKVLGSSLYNMPCKFWKAKLEKVQKIRVKDIHEILELSYNELDDDTVKAIFLDIAFFFVGKDIDEAVYVFESCEFFPGVGIQNLLDKCLLTIDSYTNTFEMHSLIQDMGRKLGKTTRLFLRGNAWKELQHLQGGNDIQGLILNLTTSTHGQANASLFERLPNLRLLQIIGAPNIKGNFKNLFPNLRCIRWHSCPLTHIPSTFCPPNLVSLDIPSSKFRTLWKRPMPLVNLKTINVSHSRNLEIMSDFTYLQSVEKLVFLDCESLVEVHPSIGRLTNLSHLDLGQCVNLKRLPEAIIQLTTLGSLKLRDCHNLTRLPEQLGDMKCLKMLDASCTSIEQLPDSIGYLKELVELKLGGCKKLRKLPAQIGNMESLKLFNARYSAIEHLPDTFGELINLYELDLSVCKNLTSLPNTLWKLKVLQSLNLRWCSKLEQLPEQLGKMQCLESLDACGTAVEELPDSIGLLSTLRVLDLDWCKVRNLPSSIWNLTSLAQLSLRQEDVDKIDLPDMVKDTKLKSLRMKCDVSLWLPVILSLSSLERLILCCVSQSSSPNEPYSLSKLSNLRNLTLNNKISGECSFPELPLNLTELWMVDYKTLEMLPDLSSLKQLKILYLWSCISLQSIPPLPPHLEELELNECTSLQDLPDLSTLKELRKLKMGKCISLQSIPPLPPHLEELELNECTSLQDLPDLSTLKELRTLKLRDCINLKSNILKQSFLQVGQHKLDSFEVDIPNKEVGEWFSYKSSGNTLSFTIPPNSNSGDNFFSGFGLWIVYKYKLKNGLISFLGVVITNRTKGTKMDYLIDLWDKKVVLGEVQRIQCIRPRKDHSMESGDRIKINIRSTSGDLKVKKCGAHVIWRKHC